MSRRLQGEWMVSEKTEAEIEAYIKEQEERLIDLVAKFDHYREQSESFDELLNASKRVVDWSRRRRVRAFGAILRAGERKGAA